MSESNYDYITSIALRAIALAQINNHQLVSLDHLLYALMEKDEVKKCLKFFKIDEKTINDSISEVIESLPIFPGVVPGRTKEFELVIGRTIALSQFSPRKTPNGLDVLYQLIHFPEGSTPISLLIQNGIDVKSLKTYIVQGIRRSLKPDGEFISEAEPSNSDEALEFIKKYCVDLNEQAINGKIDPVIGRLSEIERIVQILARRTKNNVAMVGDPGVGKTAVAEGLAYNITQGNIPDLFKSSTVWSLDISGLVAGTRFRGDFEERMKYLLKAFSFIEDKYPILFIDEIHTIMDVGSGNKGSLDVSNILKPALARGKLRCIGSTTETDWRKYMEKDRALLRRFKKLIINEPSNADAKLILHGLKKYYESFHNVTYSNEALDAAVNLSEKYISGKLPDKAIDLIDEAGSRQRINKTKEVIEVSDIEYEVSIVAKIPQQSLNDNEADKLQNMETTLKTVIFGQNDAIMTVVDAVLIGRAGLKEENKPEGSFLFTGPTGCGKTELARQLSHILSIPLIKFDMSEFTEKHSVSKFIGSPPGYVGFGEGSSGDGLLINAIESNPNCVLLLDEIEKANSDIFNILLQIMDDAKLTNSSGKTISFRNVILIMTSNVGVIKTEQNGIGFIKNEAVTIDDDDIKRMFSPEFRNRLDAIVKFNSLSKADILKIVQKFIAELQNMVSDREIRIEITDSAKKWLADNGYDEVYGARPIGRLIAEKIKKPLSRMMLFGNLKNGGTLKGFVENGKFLVKES